MRRAAIIGFIVGLAAAVAGVAAAGWFIETVGGGGQGSFATLQPLEVTQASGDAVYPGQDMPLRAAVKNPNPITLGIVNVEVVKIETGASACTAWMEGLKFRDSEIDVDPGDSNVVLGEWSLPKAGAPQACQGRNVEATVTVRAAYGENG